MKAAPLLISWHNDGQPVYSAHFEPNGKGRLATSGGDGNVRLWRVEDDGESRAVTYLSTLIRHTQAVNVVRFAPKGEMLATAGDDGNTLLWVPADHKPAKAMGEEDEVEDKETWRVKHMCRSMQAEVYDLAWSPDGRFFITGSMDNIARIYDASTGSMVRQIAEHNHYVQGVAWDPLNEYVATQSSDRSIHIYTLRTKEGDFVLKQHNKIAKSDLPGRRISNSPAPPDAFKPPSLPEQKSVEAATTAAATSNAPASPAPTPSIPGTPSSLALPMNPPAYTHSRRSSFGSPSVGRSASPAPSMPLPAVRPMEHSPIPFGGIGLGARNSALYANEALTTFFRRLSFAPDGSLLFTPAGQFRTMRPNPTEGGKPIEEIKNTVYVYTRAGFNKPPVAHLAGHKKPSIAVRCSPIYYNLRTGNTRETVNITLDTSSGDDALSALPASLVSTEAPLKEKSSGSTPGVSTTATATDKVSEGNDVAAAMTTGTSAAATTAGAAATTAVAATAPTSASVAAAGTAPVFALPYRIIYAVATQDTVLVYDTQQQTPLCVVSNLHFATFTDLTWSPDGRTLLISSSDGFCSALSFSTEELGERYTGPIATYQNPNPTPNPTSNTSAPQPPTPRPAPTPLAATASATVAGTTATSGSMSAPSPVNKSRSNSASSMASNTTSFGQHGGSGSMHVQSMLSFKSPGSATVPGLGGGDIGNNPAPVMSQLPGITAGNPSPTAGTFTFSGVNNGPTPPMTPSAGLGGPSIPAKREAGAAISSIEKGDEPGKAGVGEVAPPGKKRRIAPTAVKGSE